MAPIRAAVGKAPNAPPFIDPVVIVAGTSVVEAEIPEVNGASSTAVTPEKAGLCVAMVGTGVASAAIGFSTLGMMLATDQ